MPTEIVREHVFKTSCKSKPPGANEEAKSVLTDLRQSQPSILINEFLQLWMERLFPATNTDNRGIFRPKITKKTRWVDEKSGQIKHF